MKKLIADKKYLSAALGLAAVTIAGAAPAVAQSRDHTGSMMPFYYEGSGEQKTGSWQPEQNTRQQPAQPSAQRLYMSVRPHAHGRVQ
jgi:hypothetical protein